MNALLTLAGLCDTVNERLGQATRWLALMMVIMMTANVVMRYLFAAGEPWQQELVRFMHAILFLAAAGYALKHEAHVRVDVLYQGFSPRTKAWVNFLGTALLLLPFSVAVIYFSAGYITNSWSIYEASSEYRGMPGVFLLKSFIWVAGSTLILQGISLIIRSLEVIRAHD